MIEIQWLTAAPHPKAFAGGFDAGRHAWKRHGVKANTEQTFKEIRYYRAACGLQAKHGWDDDLFIPIQDKYEDYRCSKCVRVLELPMKILVEIGLE